MVNSDMFKGAFQIPAKVKPVPVAQAPVARQPVQVYEDPAVAKLRAFFLKWISVIVGGGAILLIVWRILLKVF